MNKSSEKKRRKDKKKAEKQLLQDFDKEEQTLISTLNSLSINDTIVEIVDELYLNVTPQNALTKRDRCNRCRVLVNPNVIKNLDTVANAIVIIEASDTSCLAQIFPMESLSQDDIQMSSAMATAFNNSITRIKLYPLKMSQVESCSSVVLQVAGMDKTSTELAKKSISQQHVPAYLKSILMNQILAIGSCYGIYLNGYFCTITVDSVSPPGFVLVDSVTTLLFQGQQSTPLSNETFAMVGGLKKQVAQVSDVLKQALETGNNPPRGILLFGPPGTGKTLIARCIAGKFKAQMYVINGAELVSSLVGQAEGRISELFYQAAQHQPSIIFIDEIDALCPSRSASSNDEMHTRIVALMLQKMDDLHSYSTKSCCRVAVLATTNRPDTIDIALRRPGRFDREIEIAVPNEQDRVEILQVHLQGLEHDLPPNEVCELARSLHGYVGADIMVLCREAAWNGLRRTKECPMVLNSNDFKHAKGSIRPSALRELCIDVPHVKWSDVGGQSFVKQQLQEAVEWPLKHPEAFIRMGIRPPQGVLLYGPPGCSKTLLAKAIATQGQMNFIAVKGPELMNKYVGESEKAVQELFRKARLAEPTVIFFDEIDALAGTRGASQGGVADRVLSQLLTEMDGMQARKRVVVVAATNRPDMIDPALMRPGRIDRLIYVPPPDDSARLDILKIHTKSTPLDEDVDMEALVIPTQGFSGAEVAALCKEAAMSALEENMQAVVVCQRHYISALQVFKPQITTAMLDFYHDFEIRQKV